jgi:hypothetical protein
LFVLSLPFFFGSSSPIACLLLFSKTTSKLVNLVRNLKLAAAPSYRQAATLCVSASGQVIHTWPKGARMRTLLATVARSHTKEWTKWLQQCVWCSCLFFILLPWNGAGLFQDSDSGSCKLAHTSTILIMKCNMNSVIELETSKLNSNKYRLSFIGRERVRLLRARDHSVSFVCEFAWDSRNSTKRN